MIGSLSSACQGSHAPSVAEREENQGKVTANEASGQFNFWFKFIETVLSSLTSCVFIIELQNSQGWKGP